MGLLPGTEALQKAVHGPVCGHCVAFLSTCVDCGLFMASPWWLSQNSIARAKLEQLFWRHFSRNQSGTLACWTRGGRFGLSIHLIRQSASHLPKHFHFDC